MAPSEFAGSAPSSSAVTENVQVCMHVYHIYVTFVFILMYACLSYMCHLCVYTYLWHSHFIVEDGDGAIDIVKKVDRVHGYGDGQPWRRPYL